MKNFNSYTPEKYSSPNFKHIEDGIYKTKDPYSSDSEEIFVTSLSFEMEPECYGEEEGSPQNISQIPFEDLLDEFNVCVTDFYDELNEQSEVTCYQEFGSPEIEEIRNLRTIIGKRIYAVLNTDEADEEDEEYHVVIE